MKRWGGGAALVALFILIPLLEVYLLIQVGRGIGVWPTLALLIGGAALGAWLMKREGTRAWQALVGAFNRGSMPSRELADAGLVLLGGALLILPGFFTDLIGMICLLPFTRGIPRRAIAWVAARQAAKHGVSVPVRGSNVIPGEVVDEQKPSSESGGPAIEGRVID